MIELWKWWLKHLFNAARFAVHITCPNEFQSECFSIFPSHNTAVWSNLWKIAYQLKFECISYKTQNNSQICATFAASSKIANSNDLVLDIFFYPRWQWNAFQTLNIFAWSLKKTASWYFSTRKSTKQHRKMYKNDYG